MCDLHGSSWPHRILNPLSKAGDGTHILMVTRQVRNPLSHSGNTLLYILKCVCILHMAERNQLFNQNMKLYVHTHTHTHTYTHTRLAVLFLHYLPIQSTCIFCFCYINTISRNRYFILYPLWGWEKCKRHMGSKIMFHQEKQSRSNQPANITRKPHNNVIIPPLGKKITLYRNPSFTRTCVNVA